MDLKDPDAHWGWEFLRIGYKQIPSIQENPTNPMLKSDVLGQFQAHNDSATYVHFGEQEKQQSILNMIVSKLVKWWSCIEFFIFATHNMPPPCTLYRDGRVFLSERPAALPPPFPRGVRAHADLHLQRGCSLQRRLPVLKGERSLTVFLHKLEGCMCSMKSLHFFNFLSPEHVAKKIYQL